MQPRLILVNQDGSLTNVVSMQRAFRRKKISGPRKKWTAKGLSLYALLSNVSLV